MPRDAVSRTANVERTGRHKWVNIFLELRNNKTDRHLGVDIRLLRLTKAFSTMAGKPEKDMRDDALS